ncbi:DUF2059 domain-containing protein [Sphingobium yanoikuyae]|uniref:DUF2059 domain-containing protein n=1 Tax=Sphingobium yanoikuyae TaxID=13690 RepID=A0A6P1GE25_SPHYA|nr:DUF2059 domain-containing protein [Sphingobium yanoikuyae]QHD66659.1 DUF2059 domain-containing protein [Sphingobium yanoikuyae]
MNRRTTASTPSRLARATSILAATALLQLCPAPAAAAQAASERSDLTQRQTLCARSVALSGLEQEMDQNIQSALEASFKDLTATFPDDPKAVEAYRDSFAEAMRAAKAPVLARMKESCAAAFTVDELNGINAFYESSAGRAWLEKGRILMRPALAQAIADVVPGVFADTQKRFCARMGGCETAPAAPAPAAHIS